MILSVMFKNKFMHSTKNLKRSFKAAFMKKIDENKEKNNLILIVHFKMERIE
jgi:mRNA-degrading endonuclease RelE of RelBE toxin-antitoxin system